MMRQRRWLEIVEHLRLSKILISTEERRNVILSGSNRKPEREQNFINEDLRGMINKLEPRTNGTLRLNNRSWISCLGDLRALIMHESHKSKIATYCPQVFITCAKVKDRISETIHGLVVQPEIPTMEMENITMTLLTKLSETTCWYNNSYHTSIKLLPFEGVCMGVSVDHTICWAEVGDSQLTGLEIIHKTTEKIVQIKSRIQASRAHQKAMASVRRKPLEFQVGDKVMLKVSPWKGVIRFGKRGKLNPRYIGPFKIIAKVGTVAKCMADEPLAIPLDEIQVDDKLNFIKEPVEIMDREVKRLKQSRIPIVKVRWNSKRGPEFTWEREDQMQKKYPHLFTNSAPAA
ncbi:hypothetical protein Tco_0790342 [Tanacetum coccineum]